MGERWGLPESFGWLRRPEFDTRDSNRKLIAYEHPDGTIYRFTQPGAPFVHIKRDGDLCASTYHSIWRDRLVADRLAERVRGTKP